MTTFRKSAPAVDPSADAFEVPVRDATGKEVERLKVAPGKLDLRVRPRLLKEAVLMYQANRRVGTHSTKTRAEIAASNKKPWRQKGTGRARAGTRRSPLWRGGGIIFGPKPRDYTTVMPRKMRNLATRSALFSKFRDGEVLVVDGLKFEEPHTRQLAKLLKTLEISGPCLIGTAQIDKNLVLSARNIPRLRVTPVRDFNALDVLTARKVLLTREALDLLVADRAAPDRAAPDRAAPTSGEPQTPEVTG
jgi:large subunit ribosomal protein L4